MGNEKVDERIDEILDRFWSKVDAPSDDECWEWRAGLFANTLGYGRFTISHHNDVLAHRFSWEIHNGKIPADESGTTLCVLHKCDNPKCVNPSHLFLGTKGDNNRDMTAKGRNRCGNLIGEKNPNSAFRDSDIIRIRQLYSAGKSQGYIAQRYGVHQATISKIISGDRWGHVT